MDIVKSLQSSQASRILWRQLKPMLCGKLLYAPDTPATRSIIKQVRQFGALTLVLD